MLRIKFSKIEHLKGQSAHSKRLWYELDFAISLSEMNLGNYEEVIDKTLDFIITENNTYGAITKNTVDMAEKMLSSLSNLAKTFQVYFVGHAHIDMNWRWRYDETVAITLDTFRTMLDLMDEYPEFKFSQSQASCYEFVEKYDKAMLNEIKKRVHQGRWEVTASQWVEGDKNIPSGEGLVRQMLYAKRYLSKLFSIKEDELNIDFEPDTFGHSAYLPDILKVGGVKYYYHCRGYDKEVMYRWQGQGNSEVLVYRDPIWYLTLTSEGANKLSPNVEQYLVDIYKRYNVKTLMRLYGLGDHGGGPSRADIEEIKDMATWPIFPTVKFSTMKEYFDVLEGIRDSLPVVKGELNPIFTGCYSSQSRIKTANRVGERMLIQAETYGALASEFGYVYDKELIEDGWRKILFNHFHDILPGSGIVDTREYSMGIFQEAIATANITKKAALRTIVRNIDTKEWIDNTDDKFSRVEGDGVGFGVKDYKLSQVDRSGGRVRAIHVFNSTQYHRNEIIDIPVWHYPGNINKCIVLDKENNKVPFVISDNKKHFEGRDYYNLTMEVNVPPLGYSTYLLTYNEEISSKVKYPTDPRVERVDDLSFENQWLKGSLTQNGAINYLVNKKTNEVVINSPTAVLNYIIENTHKPWSGNAWVVGEYEQVKKIEKINLVKVSKNKLTTKFEFKVEVEKSFGTLTISLDKNKTYLDFYLDIHWLEVGTKENGVPQLQFAVDHSYNCDEYIYEVPYGVISRKPENLDLSSVGAVVAKNNKGSSVMLLADTKSGFRGYNNKLSVTLLRSSTDPDPYPEIGVHSIKFSLGIIEDTSYCNIIKISKLYQNSLDTVVDKCKKGLLPKEKSFITVDESEFLVTSIKSAEDGADTVIRGIGYKDGMVSLISNNSDHAVYCDALENNMKAEKILKLKSDKISFKCDKNNIITLKLKNK